MATPFAQALTEEQRQHGGGTRAEEFVAFTQPVSSRRVPQESGNTRVSIEKRSRSTTAKCAVRTVSGTMLPQPYVD